MLRKTLIAISAFAVTLAGLVAAPALAGRVDGFRPPLNQARRDLGRLVEDHCRAYGDRVRPLVCVYGDRSSEKRVVLFGDSHALQWGPAIIPVAKRRDWKLYTLLRAGCPIANIVSAKYCAKWRARAMRRIEKIKPSHIIISTSIGNRYRLKHKGRDMTRRESEPRLRDGMTRSIRRLQKIPSLEPRRKAITLIRDQVLAPFLPANCLKRNRDNTKRCYFRNQRRWAPGFGWVAAKRTGILPAIDPTKTLCWENWCPSNARDILIYRDTDHVTATFARSRAWWFDRRLKRLVK